MNSLYPLSVSQSSIGGSSKLIDLIGFAESCACARDHCSGSMYNVGPTTTAVVSGYEEHRYPLVGDSCYLHARSKLDRMWRAGFDPNMDYLAPGTKPKERYSDIFFWNAMFKQRLSQEGSNSVGFAATGARWVVLIWSHVYHHLGLVSSSPGMFTVTPIDRYYCVFRR